MGHRSRTADAGRRALPRTARAVAARGDAVALLAVLGIWLWSRRHDDQRSDQSDDRARPTRLRYHVPVGQDPAAVISTLRLAGYHVERDQRPTHIQDLAITSASGGSLDRDHVRAAIEQAPIDIEGAPASPHPVVFADEAGPVTDPRRG